MNKKQALILGIALMLLFTSIALATSTAVSASSNVIIYAFDQNPAGRDEGNEWVTVYNPSNESVDIGNWTLETADGERETIAEGTTLYPFAYYVYSPPYQWLDNTDEAITLRDSKGEEVDKSPVGSDRYNDNLCWMREDSGWIFGIKELEKGKIRSGLVKNVHDGDTIDISFGIYGIRRIRLVGVNTPELGTQGGEEAKEFVNKTCLLEVIELDVDDEKQYDRYCRILAVIYVNGTNLNKELLRKEYAEIMYIPPSEFNPYEWKADCTPTPIPTLSSTSTPTLGFDFLFAIIGVLAVVYLIRRSR